MARLLVVAALLMPGCGRQEFAANVAWLDGDSPGDGGCVGAGCCMPSCDGSCRGAADGCGGICPDTSCTGCCTSAAECIPLAAESDTTCGRYGRDCADCTMNGQVCDRTAHVCVDPCTTLADECDAADVGDLRCSDAECGLASWCVQICSDFVNCVRWSTTEVCHDGTCFEAACCLPDCSGACVGGSDGCGGTCPTNACAGCCDGDANCVALTSQSDSACGEAGEACVDCGAASGICLENQCCTPECEGKCPGAADGCGGTCVANDCNGCCAGVECVARSAQSDSVCGRLGQACADCSASSEVCYGNTCCAPNCNGKCAGASDGCGGTCAVNDCGGCCSGTQCIPTNQQSNSACGAGGEVCENCTATSGVCYGNSCCTPTCSGKCNGASNSCGGTCPYNHCSGCCTTSRSCVPTWSQTDYACGKSGVNCVDCTDDSEICDSGACCVADVGEICQVVCYGLQQTVRGYSQWESVWCSGENQSLYSVTNCSDPDPDPCTTHGDPPDCGLIAGYEWCDVTCQYSYDCELHTSCDGTCE